MTDYAIPAATLILVRDSHGAPPQLLMVERAQGMAFAAGALVFPGGRIDEQDYELGAQIGGDGPAVAAIRETLEETGVPVALSPLPERNTALEMQRALVANRPFAHVLDEARIGLEPALLVPFARWVPRFHAVRRFDTMFYIAECPPGEWPPNIVEGECSGAEWVSAGDVLERDRSGQARLIFPTRRNLERLAQHSSFAEMRRDAASHPVEPITPWVEECGGERLITIPSHLGYPVTQERLDGLWRG